MRYKYGYVFTHHSQVNKIKMMLINKRLHFIMLSEHKNDAGRVVFIETLVNVVRVVMCNIYAPNKEDPICFNEVKKLLGDKE